MGRERLVSGAAVPPRRFKVFGFLSKKAGLDLREFIDHYETQHVPLICRLAPMPLVYKRRYLSLGNKLTTLGGEVDFDAMTELVFADRAAFEAWMSALAKPDASHLVIADEERFLDRARTRAYVVDERVTADSN
jgi:hypothetical protein